MFKKALARTQPPKHATSLLWTSRTISLYFAWAVIAQVTYFCTDHLGLNAGIVGSIMLFSKVADCISNFLIANYVDNHSTKWGKVRHHEIHIVLLWIDVVLMFMIPKGLGNLTKYLFIFVLYTMNCAVFQTFLNCTDTIYLRRAFKDDGQRTVVQTVSGGVGMIAMYLGVMLMPLMIDYFEDIPGGWTMLVLICAVPMAIIGSIRFFLFPEVEEVQEVTAENRASIIETLKTFVTNKYVLLITAIYFCVQLQSNMQSTPSTYYFTYIVGNLSLMSVVTLVSYLAALALLVIVPLSKKFGRTNVLRFFGLLCVIGCALRWVAGSNLVVLSVSNILASFVNYAWMAIGPLMLIDVMQYGEWKNGKLAEGAVFAATGLGNTMGSITAGQLDSNELWENETFWQMSMDILVAMASRYQGHPEVACYDLLNEPTTLPVPYVVPDMTGIELPTTPTLFYKLPERMSMPVRNFYKEAYAKVRKVDTKHILCVQQFADLNLIEQKEAYGWENVMYQFHCYPVGDWRDHDAVEASMQAYLAAVKESYAKWTSPAFAGEFCCWEFTDVWEKWVHALNEMGISWAHWSYKIADPVEKDNWSLFYDYDGVYVDYYNDNYDEIAEKWNTYNTEHYKNNEKLAKLLTKYAAE